MSAYVVSKAHIDAIVRVGLIGPRTSRDVRPDNAWHAVTWYATDARAAVSGAGDYTEYFRRLEEIRRSLDHETADRTGRMLIDACVASVKHRYPDDTDDTLPGPGDTYWTRPYSAPSRSDWRPTAVEALKLIACYEYQSCELPTWEGSEAQRFCDALRHALINALPGYDAAPWEAPEPVTA